LQLTNDLDAPDACAGPGAPKAARNFRMTYAATVTPHDAEGESIRTIRYGRAVIQLMPRSSRLAGSTASLGLARHWAVGAHEAAGRSVEAQTAA
jgi:hypothetical protein